jgi:hypothetical protein
MKVKSGKGLEVRVRECKRGQCPFCTDDNNLCLGTLGEPMKLWNNQQRATRPPDDCPLLHGPIVIKADFINSDGLN